jgi:hypothetical protein
MRAILVFFAWISFAYCAEYPCRIPERVEFDMRPKYILEAYELSDFKVHGIVSRGHGECWPYALLSDAKSHMHRVFLGDYIGKNFGSVVAFGENSVSIREVFEIEEGEWEERIAHLWVDDTDFTEYDNEKIQKMFAPYGLENSNLVKVISTGKCSPYVLIQDSDEYIHRLFLNSQIVGNVNLVFTLEKESLIVEEIQANEAENKTIILNLDRCVIVDDNYFDIYQYN